ncbi:hypothetical protein PAMP_004569 [Pampus punctatissimus]
MPDSSNMTYTDAVTLPGLRNHVALTPRGWTTMIAYGQQGHNKAEIIYEDLYNPNRNSCSSSFHFMQATLEFNSSPLSEMACVGAAWAFGA